MLIQLGLHEELYENRFAALAEGVMQAIPAARDQLRQWGVGNGMLDTIASRITERAHFLQALHN